MTRPEHWEPPHPQQLFVSARGVAAELGIPLWKANDVTWCLERRYYGPTATHYRVRRRSLEALKRLLTDGLEFRHACAVMALYVKYDMLPPPGFDPSRGFAIWRSRAPLYPTDGISLTGEHEPPEPWDPLIPLGRGPQRPRPEPWT